MSIATSWNALARGHTGSGIASWPARSARRHRSGTRPPRMLPGRARRPDSGRSRGDDRAGDVPAAGADDAAMLAEHGDDRAAPEPGRAIADLEPAEGTGGALRHWVGKRLEREAVVADLVAVATYVLHGIPAVTETAGRRTGQVGRVEGR